MVDVQPGTLRALIDRAHGQFGSRAALIADDTANQHTFAELTHLVDRSARAWQALGLRRGDRVAFWAPNVWEYVPVALGLAAMGGVAVPLNTRLKGQEASALIARSSARVLVTTNGVLGFDYASMLDSAPPTIVLRGPATADGLSFEKFLGLGSNEPAKSDDEPAPDEPAPDSAPDDIALVQYTSGTTGAPKGAMLRHRALVGTTLAWADVVGLQAGDRYLIINPFTHISGFKTGIVACLAAGATMVPALAFDVATVANRIAAERISVITGPPTVFFALLDHSRQHHLDLSSLRVAITGAAAVPPELIRRMRDELGLETILNGYGLTEATGVCAITRRDDPPEVLATTCGRAAPHTELRVDAPLGEPGEVLVRGYHVMAGYLDDDAATAEVIDPDGWLHTGDVGVLDDRGNVRITDRLKDLFICGGFNAYPAEIESLMLAHPAISQVAVIGVPDERLGEVGRAFVVLRPGASATPTEIVAWCRNEMASYKAPRTVEIVDSLPTNAAGKVTKFALRG